MLIRRISSFVIMVLTAMFCIGGAFAANASSSGYSLTVKFETEAGSVPDAQFRLYYAMSSDGKLCGDFADLNIEVGDLNSSENLNDLAYTLSSYAESGATKPLSEAKTNASGSAAFSDLSAGIYLVAGSSVQMNDILYTPKPFLVRIPGFDVDNKTVNDVIANVKYDRLVITSETVSRTVTKVWDDNDNTSRPKSVTVKLLQNGKSYDEVKLSSANNWTYTWSELPAESDWQIIEVNVPDDYTVTITLDGTVFTVLNKNDRYIPPTSGNIDTTDSSDNGQLNPHNPSESQNPSNSPNPSNPPTPSEHQNLSNSQDSPKLPQTGQLWWPVPVLIALGALLLLIGVIITRTGDDNDQT